MPSRIKVDRDPIFKMLDETENDAVETARRLGLHYNTVNQLKRLRAGLCMACGTDPIREGMTKCARCGERERKRTADKRKAARKEGRCSMCTKKLRKGSTLYCEEHFQQTFLRQKAHRLAKFGPHAMEKWLAADCTCQVCGAKKGEKRIDVHHIDEDQANGAPENLIVICQSCHWVTHRLISSRDRKALISWFEKTYPQNPLR